MLERDGEEIEGALVRRGRVEGVSQVEGKVVIRPQESRRWSEGVWGESDFTGPRRLECRPSHSPSAWRLTSF